MDALLAQAAELPHFPEAVPPESPQTSSLAPPTPASAMAAPTPASTPTPAAAAVEPDDEEASPGDHWTARLLAAREDDDARGGLGADARRLGMGLALASAYGVAAGARHGGLALAKSAALVPAALLAACAFGLPALYIAVGMVDAPIAPRRLFEATSRATASAGLVLAGLAPVAALYVVSSSGPGAAALATAAGLAVGSLAGLRVLARDVTRAVTGSGEWVKVVTLTAVFGFAVFAAAVGCRVWGHLPAVRAGGAVMDATILGRLLRDPAGIAADCRRDQDVRDVGVASLAAVTVGAAAFGCALGSYRGGVQILYAGIKIPLAMMLTLAIAAPAFHALAAALGRPWPMRSVVALALAAAGRASLLLLAFAPALWLMLDFGVGYHAAAVLATGAYAASGLAALGVLLRGLGPGSGRLLTAASFVGVFFAVGGQTSWMLRPYLVRPRTEDVPFLRARDGSFDEAVRKSSRSAAGVYDAPPLPQPADVSRPEGER